jgi:hypothetical protein
MDKSFPHLLVATIFLCLIVMNVQPIAASQLYFSPPGNNSTLSSSSSLDPPQVYFPTEEEVIAAQAQLGPDIYLRISNASQGSPSQVQGVTVTNATVTNATVTNATVTDSTMYVTWIGNGTIFLSIIQGKGPGLEDQIAFPAKPISLNNTMNASNLQITAIPGLTSITWDAIDADTGLRNVYGSLSRDGMNFYSFQISSGLNNAFNPWQPNPHLILYIEIGDPDSVCRGPLRDADATSTNATSAGNVISQTVNATTNNLGSINGNLPEGPFDGYVCLYRWA